MKSLSGHSLALAILAVLFLVLSAGVSQSQNIEAESTAPIVSHGSPKQGTISTAALRIPDRAKRLYDEAIFELRKGHDVKARKNINAALRVAPNFADALTVLGIIELAEQRPAEALEDFQRAMKADRDDGLAYLGTGCALNQLHRFDEALPYLERGSEYFPQSWQSALEMSRVWLAKGEYEKALQQVNRAVSLTPNRSVSNTIHVVRGYSLVGLKRYDEATLELQAYLAAEPDTQISTTVRRTLSGLAAVDHQTPPETAPGMGATPADITDKLPPNF